MLKTVALIILACLGIVDVCEGVCTDIKESELKSLFSYTNEKNLLGKGGFGSVYLGKWSSDSEEDENVAIKVLDLKAEKDGFGLEQLQKEVELMDQANKCSIENPEDSEGILSCFNFLTRTKNQKKSDVLSGSVAPVVYKCLIDKNQHRAFVVMQLLQGDLDIMCADKKVKSERACPVKEWANVEAPNHLKLFVGIAQNLEKLWKAGLVHDDVKPENIGVVDLKTMKTKLIDFGMAHTKGELTTGGTPHFMDLKRMKWNRGFIWAIEGKKSDPVNDMYAFGITMVELLHARAYVRGLAKDVQIFKEWHPIWHKNAKSESKYLWEKAMEIATDPEALKQAGMFECVTIEGIIDGRDICLFELYLGLIHPDREERKKKFEDFIKKLRLFIDNYDNDHWHVDDEDVPQKIADHMENIPELQPIRNKILNRKSKIGNIDQQPLLLSGKQSRLKI